MEKLVLDENISPSLPPRFWGEDVDSFHVRDRGLLGIKDHALFAMAQSAGRAVATINMFDFRKLASQAHTHAGVISIPSGSGRADQFDLIMAAINYARRENAVLPSLKDRIFYISPAGEVSAELVIRPAANDISVPRTA